MDQLDQTLARWPNAGARVRFLTIQAFEAVPPSALDLQGYPNLGPRYNSGVQSCTDMAVSILNRVPGLTHLTMYIDNSVVLSGPHPSLRNLQVFHVGSYGDQPWNFNDHHAQWLKSVAPDLRDVVLTNGFVSASSAGSRPSLRLYDHPAELEIVTREGLTITVHLNTFPVWDQQAFDFVQSCSGVENVEWTVGDIRPVLANVGGNWAGNGGQVHNGGNLMINGVSVSDTFYFERQYLATIMRTLRQCSETLKSIDLSHQDFPTARMLTGRIGSFRDFSRLQSLTIPGSFVALGPGIAPTDFDVFLDTLPSSIQSLTITKDQVLIMPQLIHFVMAHRSLGFSNFRRLKIQVSRHTGANWPTPQYPFLELVCRRRSIEYSVDLLMY